MPEINRDGEQGGDAGSPPSSAKHGRPPAFLSVLTGWVRRLSSAKESGSYTGAFSYAGEWHAPAVAFAVGYAGTTEQQRLIIWYALGRGGAKKQLSQDAHIKDVADEPAYALAALAAGKAARGSPLLADVLAGVLA